MIRGLFLLTVLVLLLPLRCLAQPAPSGKRLIVFVVPGLRASDLTNPSLQMDLMSMQHCAIGWMNTRTARVPGRKRDSEEAAYVTLGAGSRATASAYAQTSTPTSLDRLKTDNAQLDHEVRIGLLGDLLRSHNLMTLVHGAEDDVVPRSGALWMAADSAGQVSKDRTSRLSSVSDRPFGVADEYLGLQVWLWDWNRIVAPGLQVYVRGDLARADRYSNLCLPRIAAAHRNAALDRVAETTIHRLWGAQGGSAPGLGSVEPLPPTRYILMSPLPADSAPDGDRLAPILMWGDGVTPGLLTSGSTHTAGLVTNTDFLPTVAQYLGIMSPKGLVGRPMTILPLPRRTRFQGWLDRILDRPQTSATNGRTPEMWAAMHDRWYAQSRKQSLFGGLPTIQALLVVGSLLLAASPRLRSLSPCLLVSLSTLPLALLLLPPVSPAAPLASGVLLAMVLVATAGIAWLRPNAAPGLAVGLLAALVGIVALDLLAGGSLLRQAWMSYSVMEGARYYGIGNEYAGAVFGAMMALSVVTLRGERIRRWPAVAGAWLAVSVLIGLPQLGANAGGFLGAGIGCGLAALVWWKGRIRARDAALIIVAVVLAMAGVLALDLARGGAEQSHIARAISGGGSVLNIAARKAMMNGYLLFHSPWTLGLLAAAYGLWSLWRSADEVDRATRGTWAGLVAGTIGLFVLNDSGVVAAAECLLVAYAGMSLLSAHPALGEIK